MNHYVKRIGTGILAACLLTSSALAAQITPSVSRVELARGENTISFDIALKADECFAGAEFGIRPSAGDVKFRSIDYLEDTANEATVKTVKDGVLYFGFFAGDNKYAAGTYDVARVTYTYEGTAPRSITLDSSKIITIDEASNQTVGDTSTAPFTVQITRAPSGGGSGGSGGDGGHTRPVKPSEPSVTPPSGPVFTDVGQQDYFYDAVYWAVENGITLGKTETSFAPNETCTRAQMVTFLWRSAGCPQPKDTHLAFVDVPETDYYAEAVRWAVENGITLGKTETSFAPNETCTRAQMVTFLWRSAGCPQPKDTRLAFVDVPEDAYFAPAVAWATQRGIVLGMTPTTFAPDHVCTRGQIVTCLYRNTLA